MPCESTKESCDLHATRASAHLPSGILRPSRSTCFKKPFDRCGPRFNDESTPPILLPYAKVNLGALAIT